MCLDIWDGIGMRARRLCRILMHMQAQKHSAQISFGGLIYWSQVCMHMTVARGAKGTHAVVDSLQAHPVILKSTPHGTRMQGPAPSV